MSIQKESQFCNSGLFITICSFMFPPPSRLKESQEQGNALSSHSLEGIGERQERNNAHSNGHDERHRTEFR